MTKGCKFWLWIIFVANIFFLAMSLISGADNLGIKLYALSVTAQIVSIFAIFLMLFQHRKIGFYIYVLSIIAAFFVSVFSGVSIIYSIIAAIISPAITYFFISRNKEVIV